MGRPTGSAAKRASDGITANERARARRPRLALELDHAERCSEDAEPQALFSPTAEEVDVELEAAAAAAAAASGGAPKRPAVTVRIPPETSRTVVFPGGAGNALVETPAPERVDEIFAKAAARPVLSIAVPARAPNDDRGDRGDAAKAADGDAPLPRLETPTMAQLEAMLDARAGDDDASAAAAAPAAPVAGEDDAATAHGGAGGGTAMVRGLPKNWDERDMAKWLDMLVVSRASCRKKKSWPYGFISFGFLKDRLEVQGRTVTVHEALARRAGDKNGAGGVDIPAAVCGKRGGVGEGVDSTSRTREELLVAAASRGARRDVRDAVCPLWRMPYAKQLAQKREKVEEALRQLTRTVAKNCKRAKKSGNGGQWRWPTWIAEANRTRSKTAAPMQGIVRSPVLEGYRNKSEFSVGPDADGVPTVGFNVGLFKEGVTAVASPEECRHISPGAKALAAALQAHIRAEHDAAKAVGDASKALPTWDKRRGAGFWRLLTVREGGLAPPTGAWAEWVRDIPAAGAVDGAADDDGGEGGEEDEEGGLPYPAPKPSAEVMVVMQVSPAGFDPDVVRDACARLSTALHAAAAAASPPFPLTRVLMQAHDGVSNAAPADAPLFDLATGKPSDASDIIHEELCGLRFSLSAAAFFQVNTCAAEVLYNLAGEWASPTGKSLLLDVCCGTGTIGLTLAGGVGKVLGVDIVAAAVEDAKANAALNGIENCEWVAGRAEEVLPVLLDKYAPLIAPPPPTAPLPARTAASNRANAFDDPEASGDEEAEAAAAEAEAKAAAAAEAARAKAEAEAAAAAAAGVSYAYDDVVAIVDPPRAGLHKNVLWALRKETRLRRLVYVSCNPESMAANCAELCTPQGPDGMNGGPPFVPVKAMAVDLFPHTPHCEAVLLLER